MVKRLSLPDILIFDWGAGNLEHIKKHNVGYNECEEAFYNLPFLAIFDKEHSNRENRYQALGQTNKGRLLFVSYTLRDEKIRVISSLRV